MWYPRHVFNVADWAFRETPAGLVLRPTLWHALAFRLLFGTGTMAILTLPLVGIDWELTKREEQRRVSEEEQRELRARPDPRPGILRRDGRVAEAEAVEREVEAGIAKYVRDHEQEYLAMKEANAPWHLSARALACVTVFFGLYYPLSPLWQRVRIRREGDTLVIRKNVFPKEGRIAVRAAADARIASAREEEHVPSEYAETASRLWQVILEDGPESLDLYVAIGAPENGGPPARAVAFVEALRRLADGRNPR